MSRYIDADAFMQDVNNSIAEMTEVGIMVDGDYLWCKMNDALENAPSIDIVRCKECRHNYNKVLNHGKMHPRCDFTDWKLSENDYCSRGEREGE